MKKENEKITVTEEPIQKVEKEAPKKAPKPKKFGTVNVERLNVREKASVSSNVVTVIAKNTKLEIIGTSNDFYKIKISDSDTVGYVMRTFVTC